MFLEITYVYETQGDDTVEVFWTNNFIWCVEEVETFL